MILRLLFTAFILTLTILGSNVCCLAQNLLPAGYSYESSINTNRVRYNGTLVDGTRVGTSIELYNFIYTYDKKYIILFHRSNPVEISFWNAEKFEHIAEISVKGWKLSNFGSSVVSMDWEYDFYYYDNKFYFNTARTLNYNRWSRKYFEYNLITKKLTEMDFSATESIPEVGRSELKGNIHNVKVPKKDNFSGISNWFFLDDLLVSFNHNTGEIIFARAINDDNTRDFSLYNNKSEKLSTGDFYSLIIGVNEYSDGKITDLDRPISDAENIQKVLIDNYTFDDDKSILLKNPTRSDIYRAFHLLGNKIKPEDNLLVFYAGHGYWEEETDEGYWLPSNAILDYNSEWISVGDLNTLIKKINCINAIIIADACFSGALFKTRSINNDFSTAIEELYNTPARKAITSGEYEKVQDNSVFMTYLLKQLRVNTKNYLSAEELFYKFKQAVINNSNNSQIPQYGTLSKTGDEGGDFIFIRKQ